MVLKSEKSAAGPPPATLDPQRQRLARQYARAQRLLWVASSLFQGGVLLAFWLAGSAERLAGAVRDWPYLLQPLAIGAVIGLAQGLVSLPFHYAEGYALPRQYGLLHQRLGSWLLDQLKGGVLVALFGAVGLVFLYGMLRLSPDWWWLWSALGLLGVSIVLAQWAPVLLVPLFFKMTPLGDTALADRLRQRAEQAGTHVQGVYTLHLSAKTNEANAALMGLGRTRRIVLGDTLLDQYTPEEIDAVFLHELGHHVHRDLWRQFGVGLAVCLIQFWLVHLVFRELVVRLSYEGVEDVAALPLLLLLFGISGLITLPVQNSFSRLIERAADRYALAAGADPGAFASALARLANQNLAVAEPPAWEEWLFYSHPAIGRRIAFARARQAG